MIIPQIKVNYKVLFICGLAGILLMVIGIYAGFYLAPSIVNNKILETKVLREGTEQWSNFMKVPFPFQFKVYLFTVQNVEAVQAGAKPLVQEQGPYVYQLTRWKDQVAWNHSTDEISYHEYEEYKFDAESSGGLSEQDVVTVLNPAFLVTPPSNTYLLLQKDCNLNSLQSFLYTAEMDPATRDFLPLIDESLDAIFGSYNSPFFTNITVREFLFEGLRICRNGCSDDGFVAKMACNKIKERMADTKQMRADGDDILYASFHYVSAAKVLQKYVQFKLSLGVLGSLKDGPFIRWSIAEDSRDTLYILFVYTQRNNSHQGYITVAAGQKNATIGEITQLDHQTTLNVWSKDQFECNRVSGLTTVFPTGVGFDTTFQSFSEDICRTVSFEYSRRDMVGLIKGNRYEALKSTFNTSKNACFCTDHTRNFDGDVGCLYDGVLDLTTCQGAPVLVSFPHLLYADSRYLDKVAGLNPDPSKHAMFVTLEPTSGTPLKVAKRVQFNLLLRSVRNITSLEAVGKSIVPMFWIEESTTLPEKYQDVIKNKIYRTLLILDIVRYAVLALAITVIVCCIVLFIYAT
uniref:Sensory neuron membrane protein 2 n=1 Tax=Dendroctonus ponderosae TaxID=77166 RepID=A0AAR5QBN4_DENPD